MLYKLTCTEDTIQWETFEGENFHKFCSFVAICKSFLHKIWGLGVFWSGKSEQSAFLQKSYFHQFAKVFSLESFPLYGILHYIV